MAWARPSSNRVWIAACPGMPLPDVSQQALVARLARAEQHELQVASQQGQPDRETTQLGNFFYRGVAPLADGVTPAPGSVTNAAHRSIRPRRWSNRSLRA